MKKVLFVTYGSGHVRMVMPVAQALAESGLAQVQVLALTTAAPVARAAGLDVLQFRDFVTPADSAALEHGMRLMQAMPGPIGDAAETQAYLGLCYHELEQVAGPQEAARGYQRDGRQAFLPLNMLRRILSRTAPVLVVATNSPRAERAAIMAAGGLGIPSICMVDLFCLDEDWIWDDGYADRVCVLNEDVKKFLTAAGRRPAQVTVTGNPAFDALADPANVAAGRSLRSARGWDGGKVVLWPTQVEPAFHPFNGLPGNPLLPRQALAEVIEYAASRKDVVLCVRPRAGEEPPVLPDDPRFVISGQDVPLTQLLHAVDLVVTLNSTVGLEGHLAGAKLVQVLGSVFDAAMPLKAYGLADEAVGLGRLGAALQRCLALPRAEGAGQVGQAGMRVLDVIRSFL